MVLAEASPSTLGTLISGGLIKGGLAIKDKTEADVSGLAVFFSEFVEKISLTGKAKFGDKTIVDALFPAAESLKDSAAKGLDFQESFKAAYEKAKTGFEETKNLLAKFGRAKRYGEQSIGIVDPGAAAGMLFVKAFYDYFNR
jgi:dihydroxyacetone kinase